MITPPNGSADCSGMKDSVSSVACHRKEFTPSVRVLVEEMAVEPVAVSGMSLSLEPQDARRRAQRMTAGTRIIISNPYGGRRPSGPRGLILGQFGPRNLARSPPARCCALVIGGYERVGG